MPDRIRGRGKRGYSLPIKNWLRHDLNDYMTDVLTSSPLLQEAFNVAYIQGLIQAHQAYKAKHNHILWALINLAVWHRQYVEAV